MSTFTSFNFPSKTTIPSVCLMREVQFEMTTCATQILNQGAFSRMAHRVAFVGGGEEERSALIHKQVLVSRARVTQDICPEMPRISKNVYVLLFNPQFFLRCNIFKFPTNNFRVAYFVRAKKTDLPSNDFYNLY